MHRVSVGLRDGQYFVTTVHGSDGGSPCLEAGPVTALQATCTAIELAQAIRQGLDKSTKTYPYPENSEQWKRVTEPLFRAARVKSWNAYAKRASSLTIDRDDDCFKIRPTMRDSANGFSPVVEREREMRSPSDEELGQFVVSELQFALQRDGAR
jgi:hypothetical protein